IFDIAGSALSAQSTRLNTVASNIANAEVASPTAEGVYRSRQPLFASLLRGERGPAEDRMPGVTALGLVGAEGAPRVVRIRGRPPAEASGYVYCPATSTVEEMASMISASRSYQNNVEVASTVKQLMLRTLQLGQR